MMTKVSELLARDAILLQIESRDKIDVIRELSRPLIENGTVTDEETFFEAILRRENLESTGIGLGVAIPHARTPAVARTALAFGRSEAGVDFNSLDGKPAFLVFLIAAPEDRKTEYIMTLARVSRLMRRDEARIALNRAQTPNEVIAVVQQYE
ncbi:MAG TPA: PTS sugar transporter subunit IIA [candidate division WOR-3 bacterium]|uniref:PTS sugar transporter subunit IIA n=1 Tax=candidate division WOR-3 bacterium TaxID=2052148 RepID=A0A7V0XFH0_UNCW3|nr:PTS sugar transporter subunit IIA [candidate division WOR-3 bacterium]